MGSIFNNCSQKPREVVPKMSVPKHWAKVLTTTIPHNRALKREQPALPGVLGREAPAAEDEPMYVGADAGPGSTVHIRKVRKPGFHFQRSAAIMFQAV